MNREGPDNPKTSRLAPLAWFPIFSLQAASLTQHLLPKHITTQSGILPGFSQLAGCEGVGRSRWGFESENFPAACINRARRVSLWCCQRMPSTRSREQPYAFATLWHDVVSRLQLPPSILTCRENHPDKESRTRSVQCQCLPIRLKNTIKHAFLKLFLFSPSQHVHMVKRSTGGPNNNKRAGLCSTPLTPNFCFLHSVLFTSCSRFFPCFFSSMFLNDSLT